MTDIAPTAAAFPGVAPRLFEMMKARGLTERVLTVAGAEPVTPRMRRLSLTGEALAGFLLATAPRWAAASAGDPAFGLFHFANAGQASRFDFAKAAIDRDPLTRARLEPTTQAAFAEPAPRPPRSPLDTSKLQAVFGVTPEPWRPAVERTADRLVAAGLRAWALARGGLAG